MAVELNTEFVKAFTELDPQDIIDGIEMVEAIISDFGVLLPPKYRLAALVVSMLLATIKREVQGRVD